MVKIIKEELSFKKFNQEYNLDSILKKKGRNIDIHVSEMNNYEEILKRL